MGPPEARCRKRAFCEIQSSGLLLGKHCGAKRPHLTNARINAQEHKRLCFASFRTLVEDRHPPLTPATQMDTEFGTVSKFEPRAWNSKSGPSRSDV